MGLDRISQFHFLRPWWLLTILPVLFFIRYLFGNRRIQSKWRGVIAPHLLDHLVVSAGDGRRLKPTHMLLLAGLLASLAMAGPTWERTASPFAEDRAPLAIVLDLSKSMDQTDIQPSRLERAKQKIRDLLAMRKGSKTGVIVYAGSSHVLIPPTNDPRVIENLLFAVKTDMMPKRGKAMEKTLPMIQKMFQDPGVPGTILLITDGASLAGRQAFSHYCRSSGHQLIVYATGREQQDRPGHDDNDVFHGAYIPLAVKELEGLAKDADGTYQALTADKSDIKRISRRIDLHFISAKDQTRPWIDAGYYLLFPMAFVFVLWFRKGWTLTWCIACIMVTVCTAPPPAQAFDADFLDLWLTPDQQGRYFFEEGEYEKAANRFEDTLWKGVAFYMNKNFEPAIELFARIETQEGYFNLGNALAHGQYYVKAVAAYHHVLEINPEHEDTKKNLRIVQGIIDEINRVSEAQKSEPGEASKPLGDEPMRATGAKRLIFGKKEDEHYSAEQILNDPELNEIWMRQVQQDQARFLSLKFQMQVNSQSDENTGVNAR
jgi:Ca-activated chloride channel family protein